MVLEEVCRSSVYSSNAFYVLGLQVDMTSRRIRRRQEDVIEGCSVMGPQAWQSEFDRYLLGDSMPPKVDVASNLFERLKDPEYFATEMFFWFWPLTEQEDPALAAIAAGDRGGAVRQWLENKDRTDERGIVARHNLAVALHFYAIEGETHILSHVDGVDSEYHETVDQYWKSAFGFWEDLVDDELFWDAFATRVEKLNDPRLDGDFIEAFRDQFPICFDNINADFLVAYAQAGKLTEAKRHFDYMSSTMSAVDDVEETLERAFKPMVDKVRTHIKQCESVNEPKKVLSACRDLLSGAMGIVTIFKTLVPKGNTFTRGVLNDIVSTVDSRLPAYSRATGDYGPCLELTRELLPIAATPLQAEKIRKSIAEWEDLVRKDREDCTCCVCGRYQKGIATKEVKLHKDVRADLTMVGRVEWRTRTVPAVPVCTSCSLKFKLEHARKYEPVRLSLAEGWKLGEKPTQAEMDAVRFW